MLRVKIRPVVLSVQRALIGQTAQALAGAW
jgi:hypothetical protein